MFDDVVYIGPQGKYLCLRPQNHYPSAGGEAGRRADGFLHSSIDMFLEVQSMKKHAVRYIYCDW
jgi:hypothetical protein